MNILITSAGRRVSLVKAFKLELIKIFPGGKVFTADLNPELAPACRISDGYFKLVRVTEQSYCDRLIEICLANDIRLVIPTIDTELIPLAEGVQNFKENGINLIVSSIEMVRICRDKKKLFSFFDSIRFPRTEEADMVNTEFPLFMKPLNGSSSIGSMIITDKVQLSEKLMLKEENLFLKYFSPEKFAEFTIDLYFDKASTLKCAVPRERIEVRTGEVSKAVTRKNEVYDNVCSVFSSCEGLRGCITLQVFKNKDTDDIVGIEINPRFGGGYPLSYRAGANFPEYLIKEYLKNEIIPYFEAWEKDLLMLRYDDEIIVHDYKS